jgi:hypothetical protein
MRKVMYIFSGIVMLLACMIAINAYIIIHTPVPEITENVASVDSLIDTLLYEAEHSPGTVVTWTYSMKAIVKIGEPAVPKLIDAIETAHDRAVVMNDGNLQTTEEAISHDASILQTRAAMVLGKIKDSRAVPVLMKMKGIHCLYFCRYVDEAIKSIQEKEKLREVSE